MRRSKWCGSVVVLAALAVGCDPSGARVTTGRPAEPSTPQTEVAAPEIEIDVDEPTNEQPFAAAAAVTPAEVRPGETVTFVIRAKTAADWHIYTVDQPSGVAIQTTLDMNLPEGVTDEGEWTIPVAEPYKADEPTFVYHGDFLFHRKLRIADDAAPGPLEVKCDFGYQACTSEMCLPPTTTELTAKLEIIAD